MHASEEWTDYGWLPESVLTRCKKMDGNAVAAAADEAAAFQVRGGAPAGADVRPVTVLTSH